MNTPFSQRAYQNHRVGSGAKINGSRPGQHAGGIVACKKTLLSRWCRGTGRHASERAAFGVIIFTNDSTCPVGGDGLGPAGKNGSGGPPGNIPCAELVKTPFGSVTIFCGARQPSSGRGSAARAVQRLVRTETRLPRRRHRRKLGRRLLHADVSKRRRAPTWRQTNPDPPLPSAMCAPKTGLPSTRMTTSGPATRTLATTTGRSPSRSRSCPSLRLWW